MCIVETVVRAHNIKYRPKGQTSDRGKMQNFKSTCGYEQQKGLRHIDDQDY